MTEQEFDEALKRLQRSGGSVRDETWSTRLVFAACQAVMKHSLGIPEEQEWQGPTDAELTEFLAGLDKGRRKILKWKADELEALGFV